jgi:hypothetical protein
MAFTLYSKIHSKELVALSTNAFGNQLVPVEQLIDNNSIRAALMRLGFAFMNQYESSVSSGSTTFTGVPIQIQALQKAIKPNERKVGKYVQTYARRGQMLGLLHGKEILPIQDFVIPIYRTIRDEGFIGLAGSALHRSPRAETLPIQLYQLKKDTETGKNLIVDVNPPIHELIHSLFSSFAEVITPYFTLPKDSTPFSTTGIRPDFVLTDINDRENRTAQENQLGL